jgi:hypothetical protein
MRVGVPLEPVGATIAGRYRVEEMVGRGGMAAVYRVRDERSGAQLALKRGWARDSSKLKQNAALLEHEFHTLAQLAHPRIIEVYDYGLDEVGPYYTMELLDGSDLESAGRLEWREVCAVLCDVASSLAILHSRGLVHRDVSSRNVRRTKDGHAKLIDFGAMTSIGVAKDIVGTPPFMAPEVLQVQALDARADLFSLGALGYFLLTNRHAFAARRLSDLRNVWRSRPMPPERLVANLPPALSTLIMRLLALDRGARPHSAGDVIEQLRTLANLPPEDASEVSRAYLTTPTLVGREQALLVVRRRILSLMRGDGGVLLVQGVPGSGRSRLLDACALEGKLLGAAVVRADPRDAAGGDWGVARALSARLLEQFPKQEAEATRLSRSVVGHVVDDLSVENSQTFTAPWPERSLLIRELRDMVLAIAREQQLLIVVDDADRIDEPSAALLAALAHKSERHSVMLALVVERDNEPTSSDPRRLLRALSHTIEVEHLSAADTEALMRSVFGDVPNLSLCATRIHSLSHGNPRAAMELAQHLVDTGRARYQAGSWGLPAALDDGDLPRTLAASLAARLRNLGDDARELCDVLALAEEPLPLASYAAASSHRDMKRVYRALDELVAARILIADREQYDFAQRGFLAVVRDSIDAERSAAIHVRHAELLAGNGGDVLRRAQHLFAAGRDAPAIDLLCSVDLAARLPPLPLLATAVERAGALSLPAKTLHRLRMALLVNAPFALASDSFRRVLPLVLQQLEHDSGLTRYRELSHLPEPERLSQALAQTQLEHAALPEQERVHTIIDAVRELAQLTSSLASMAAPVFDLELLESLPSLEPLLPLSPTLHVVAQVAEGAKEWVRGRLMHAQAIYHQTLARIAQPDRGGLDDAQHDRMRFGLEFTLGLLEASFGIDAEARASLLDGQRSLRVNAWRIRMMYYFAMGNAVEARKCARRVELLQAQEGVRERYVGSTAGMEVMAYWRLQDLPGVRSLNATIAALAAQHAGWHPVELLGRSCLCELQGDLAGALEAIEAALAMIDRARHPFFSALASTHLGLLRQVGRIDDAVRHAKDYAAFSRDFELPRADIPMAAALVMSAAGDNAAALGLIEPPIETAVTLGRSGFVTGQLYEARARIAIAMQDPEAFELWAERCAHEYEKAENPGLASHLGALFDEARRNGIIPSDAVAQLQHSLPCPAESEFETLHSRIAECVDGSDRARCALTLLLQSSVSAGGYLYGMKADGRAVPLAALPDIPADEGLTRWVEDSARALLNQDSTATDRPGDDDPDPRAREPVEPPTRYLDQDGRWFEVNLLFDRPGRGRKLAAVLALQLVAGPRVLPPLELCTRIAGELLQHGDATGLEAE